MNMNGITPNFNIGEMFGVKPTEKGSAVNYNGPSFAENLSEIAKSAGISRMQLSRLEANRSNPSMVTLLKLSNVLGVPPANFVGFVH